MVFFIRNKTNARDGALKESSTCGVLDECISAVSHGGRGGGRVGGGGGGVVGGGSGARGEGAGKESSGSRS